MADKIEDGGQAFPCDGWADELGMSLRKWFAGQALVGLVEIHNGIGVDPVSTARAAYQFADAMIKIGEGEL